MLQINRIIAAIVTLAIMAIILTFAYGYYITVLEAYFSFSVQSLMVLSALAVGLLMIVFFGRPPSHVRRVVYGVVATIALGFGAYGAFIGSLLLGDALILILGTIITAVEATEDSEAALQPARPARSFATKSKLQQTQ